MLVSEVQLTRGYRWGVQVERKVDVEIRPIEMTGMRQLQVEQLSDGCFLGPRKLCLPHIVNASTELDVDQKVHAAI